MVDSDNFEYEIEIKISFKRHGVEQEKKGIRASMPLQRDDINAGEKQLLIWALHRKLLDMFIEYPDLRRLVRKADSDIDRLEQDKTFDDKLRECILVPTVIRSGW